jgi:hypothetical protein
LVGSMYVVIFVFSGLHVRGDCSCSLGSM